MRLIQLSLKDNIAIAASLLPAGAEVQLNGAGIRVRSPIPAGHKVALTDIGRGSSVLKYGGKIGQATAEIRRGEHVHSHNLVHHHEMPQQVAETRPPAAPAKIRDRTFEGYVRADGRVGTRNYIAVISTVNCSASAAHYIARHFDGDTLAEYEHIDGIVPFSYEGGCAMAYASLKHEMLSRVLAGLTRHPNIGGCLLVGLGCEQTTVGYLAQHHGVVDLKGPDGRSLSGHSPGTIPVLSIQSQGGFRRTVDAGVDAVREMLDRVNGARRQTVPANHLIVGLECGGSDGYSGVTANPAVGVAADRFVAAGGTAILSETSEVYGAEHLLLERARSPEVAAALLERLRWWQQYVGTYGVELDNNPSVGNKAGGLTTIAEKSLGAVAKAGSTALEAVYHYAMPVTHPGLVLMDTPGFDPASVTGMVAGGANLILFTTGRGSCFGCKPSPSIKISSNSDLFQRLPDDMDIDAGKIIDGTPVAEVGEEIFEEALRVASGKKTKSELQGIGDYEFVPWAVGPTL